MRKELYRILILDDELESMYNIMTTLKQIPYVDVVHQESDVRKARQIMDKGGIDILFLDVMMPEVDGFTFLGFLRELPATIICSANNTSSVEAFDLEVVDYISKLSSRKRVERALLKAIKYLEEKEAMMDAAVMTITLTRTSDEKEVQIDWREIVGVTIADDILTVFYADADEEEYNCSLLSFMDKVPDDQFFRIHRSHIVRIDAIRYRKNKTLLLLNWKELPVGASYMRELDKVIERSKFRPPSRRGKL